MLNKNDLQKIIKLLEEEYPNASTKLNYNSAWQLLLATILSAQCTDKRVNLVTKELFEKYPGIEDINQMSIDKLKDYIRPTGFFNNKAKNIKASAKMIVESFDSKVPDNMESLLKLPGIARKSANVILTYYFNKTVGVIVDTHVKRLSKRIGLTKENDPVKIEKDLMKLNRKENWERISTLLVFHGRNICKARKVFCDKCVLNKICQSAFKI